MKKYVQLGTTSFLHSNSHFIYQQFLINIDMLEEYFKKDAEREDETMQIPKDYGILRMQK